jgi:hypothetical protein
MIYLFKNDNFKARMKQRSKQGNDSIISPFY